ncbi:hypothetical protein [Actinacidiphila glaucinigra]|uniref:hypothetical protein n=1 Tax=Actinacidiphila glaucinigra TaxID=235986 RepID=UPI00366D270A
MIGYADLTEEEEIPTRVFVVWEHLVGLPGPRYSEARFNRRVRWSRKGPALDLFEVTNEGVVSEMWRLWEQDVPVALVTYLPEEVAGELAVRVDAECIPKCRLVVTTPQQMARQIGLLGDVHLFHALPDHVLLYGPRGMYVHPHYPQLIGRAG